MNEVLQINTTDGSEPVTLQQAKDFIRVTSEDDDAIITDLITVARQKIERFTGLTLTDADITLTATLDGKFKLPYGPLDEIDTVKFLEGQETDGTNDWETLDADEYQIVAGHFIPKYKGTYEITYSVTGNTDKSLLYDLKRVLLWLYENRGDDSDEMPKELMSNAKHLKVLSWV